MSCRSTPSVIVVALVAASVSTGPAVAYAAGQLTPFAPRSFGVRPALASHETARLTPETVFPDAVHESSVVSSSIPLLRIPASPSRPNNVAHDRGALRPATLRASRHVQTGTGVDTEAAAQRTGERVQTAPAVPSAPAAPTADHRETDRSDGIPSFAGLEQMQTSLPPALDDLPRLMFTTLIVLATCAGTLLLVRRWLMQSGMVADSGRNRRLQIVATLSIAPRSQLHVVKFDDCEVLVGVDSRGLQQMQLVPPSFDTALQTAQEQDIRTTEAEESNDVRRPWSAQRLMTAV